MPQNESKDQPQNGTATSNKTEDVVDAEFTELGDNPIPSSQTTWEQSRPHRQYTWSSVLVGCVGVALIYFFSFISAPRSRTFRQFPVGMSLLVALT